MDTEVAMGRVLASIRRAALCGSLAFVLMLSGYTTYQPLPPPRIFNFNVMPIDPPKQDEDEKVCVPIGFDGLACRDAGMEI